MKLNKDSQQPEKSQPKRWPPISRRRFLQLMGLGTALGAGLIERPVQGQSQPNPTAPTSNRFELHLPYAEASVELSGEQKLQQAIAQYYPNITMENFEIISNGETWIDRSLEAWRFWLNYMHSYYQRSKDTLASFTTEPGYFLNPDSVKRFTYDFTIEDILSYTHKRKYDDGSIEITLATHSAHNNSILSEFLHLVEDFGTLSDGKTTPLTEGLSTLADFILNAWWVSYNDVQANNGTPENAILPPAIDMYGNAYINPSLETFKTLMIDRLTWLLTEINRSQNFLPIYENQENLG